MSELSSMVDLLRRRAAEQPDDRAYVFLSEKGTEEAELTFAELYRRAGVVAAYLAKRLRRGDRSAHPVVAGILGLVIRAGVLLKANGIEVTDHRVELSNTFIASRQDAVANLDLVFLGRRRCHRLRIRELPARSASEDGDR